MPLDLNGRRVAIDFNRLEHWSAMADECTLGDRLVIGARWTSRLFSSTSISFRPADQSATSRKLDKMTAAFAYGIRSAESPTKPQFASAVTQIADCHFDRLDASLRLVRADLRQEHNIARRQPRKAESIAKVEQTVFCHIDR